MGLESDSAMLEHDKAIKKSMRGNPRLLVEVSQKKSRKNKRFHEREKLKLSSEARN